MGFYSDRVVPRVVERVCATSGLDRWRRKVCEGLSGRVLEIGFGSGRNLAFYPLSVTHVDAVEPSTWATERARRQVTESDIPVHVITSSAERIPLDDASCDSALITFTLCTIPDVANALGEVARILRPGGTLHFLEHGRSPDETVAKWQHRLDPLEQRLAGGCHLSRDPVALLHAAGYSLVHLEQRYARGPKPWTYFSLGVARPRH